MIDIDKIATWYGKPIGDYTKDELIDIINQILLMNRRYIEEKQHQVDFLFDCMEK